MCCQCDENEPARDKNKPDLVHIWYIITCSRNQPFWCSPMFIIVFRTACQCSVLRQMKDPPQVLESYFFKLLSNIICPLTSRCPPNELPSRLPTELVSRYFIATCQNPPIFFVPQQPNSGLESLTVEASTSHTIRHTHTHTHTAGITPLNEWSARRRSRYPQTQQTSIHSLSGIRTRDHSNQVDSELRRKSHGHTNRTRTHCILSYLSHYQ